MREKYLALFLLQVGGAGDHLTVPGQDTCHGAVTLHPGTGHVTYATCAVDRPGHVPMSGAGGQDTGVSETVSTADLNHQVNQERLSFIHSQV